MHTMTERFTDALHRIDSDRDVQPMVDLTGDDAELVKLDEHHQTTGKDGAKTFWEDYRNVFGDLETTLDRKSTRLNSSHANISYAVFCLKKKKTDYDDLD